MGSKEEIVAAIAETGSKIKAIKDEKAPTMTAAPVRLGCFRSPNLAGEFAPTGIDYRRLEACVQARAASCGPPAATCRG